MNRHSFGSKACTGTGCSATKWVSQRVNAEFTSSWEFRPRFTGAIRAMAMTIRCDFRAIKDEAKASADAALILGGLLLLIAP